MFVPLWDFPLCNMLLLSKLPPFRFSTGGGRLHLINSVRCACVCVWLWLSNRQVLLAVQGCPRREDRAGARLQGPGEVCMASLG